MGKNDTREIELATKSFLKNEYVTSVVLLPWQ